MASSGDFNAHFDYLEVENGGDASSYFEHMTDHTLPYDGAPRTNMTFSNSLSDTIHDVRTQNTTFTLDKNGFKYTKYRPSLDRSQFYKGELVETVHLPEMEEVIRRNIEGVDRVVFYNWRVRTSDTPQTASKTVDYSDGSQPLGPATRVHIDHSPWSIAERVIQKLPEEADYLLKGRVQLINLWHPISHPVQNWPLAVCNGLTVNDTDIVESDRIKPNFKGKTVYVLHNKAMKWYYMSQQQREDVLIFKTYDSRAEVARYCPHASCAIPCVPSASYQPRESIEVRAFVFTYPRAAVDMVDNCDIK